MNIRETVSVLSPFNETEECARFIIDGIDEPFVFYDIADIGQDYVFSGYIKSAIKGSVSINGELVETTTSWQYFDIRFKATSKDVPIYFNVETTYDMYHSQLESGTEDTAYKPAIEDTEERVDGVLAIAEQNKEGFSWLVSSGTSASNFILTDRVAELVAGNINLKGLVTFSGLDENTQNRINNGVRKVDVMYATSASPTVEPTSEWSTTAPAWKDGEYMWQKTVTTYIDGTSVESSPTVLTGATGKPGTNGKDGTSITILGSYDSESELNSAHPTGSLGDGYIVAGDLYVWNGSAWENVGQIQGNKGDTGVGVSGLTEQYYLSASNTSQSGGSWSEQSPTWVSGKYIWTRTKIDYDNGTTSYTTPVLANALNSANSVASSAWTGLQDLYYPDTTMIDGGKLYAKSITAEQIDIKSIFAQDIEASGTIYGVTLKGATGSFSGSVVADSLIANTRGKISMFQFDSNGMWVNFTDDSIRDYGFYKDLFSVKLYNSNNEQRAWIYADTEDTTPSIKGRISIYAKEQISLQVSEGGRINFVNYDEASPNAWIDSSGSYYSFGNIRLLGSSSSIEIPGSMTAGSFIENGIALGSKYLTYSVANGFPGFTGNGYAWVRTTSSGLIPYESNATSGASSLGTSTWPFATVYANRLYAITNAATEVNVYAQNSLHSGSLSASAAGNFGIWSFTHNKWLIVCGSNGAVSLPTFSCSGLFTAGGNIEVHGNVRNYFSTGTAGYYNTVRVSAVSSVDYTCLGNSSYGTRIYGSGNVYKGSSTTTYFQTTSSSDERLKEFVSDMSVYEDFFMNIKPMAFKFHDGLYNVPGVEPSVQWGFYAGDVIKAFEKSGLDWTREELVIIEDGELSPEELKYVDDGRLLKMNYQNLTALNTHMIQKNVSELDKLKTSLKRAHDEIAKLKNEIRIMKETA